MGGRAELAPDSFARVIRKSRVKALGNAFLNSDVLHSRVLNVFSRIQLVYKCKCCNLIG